ncbi:MAG: alpha-1,2-fucosyltransferase [Candidatus Contendobacter sp.]|nr:alpha-1,2-fucosyltransferase [Candidatus Contendobacter sp.]
MSHKIIARIKGGLGNQLFCYAAARRLALVNNAELVIDNVTGFVRDRQYRRQYMLDRFHIPARKATPAERLEPFERYRRGIMQWWSRRTPFTERCYLEQEGIDFDERLLSLKVRGILYLDGLWQSEGYFKDMERTIRADLRIQSPTDPHNQAMVEQIQGTQAVAVHVRWFDAPGSVGPYNAAADYYHRAIALMNERIPEAHYFLFSDDPVAARAQIPLPDRRLTSISHNQGDENAYADLWLMSQCQHFITANSTFSWWGAWLGQKQEKIVITPDLNKTGKSSWGFIGLIPLKWLRV